ncbi:MAG: TetR/AcrR family transcriptional regulator [Ilumatobacter sp.]|nr:TetR/AcrR family transcriptional regulator [Ilumatobacter sp.]
MTGATMEEIARRAGVGKDTLYRRWSSKELLAVDLVATLARDAVRPAPLELDPSFNLFVYLKDVVRLCRATDFGPLVAGLVGASARNDGLARSFQDFWQHRRRLAAPLVRDVRHDLDDGRIEVVLDRLFGPIYYRLLLTGGDIDDQYLWDLATAVPWSIDQPTFSNPPSGADPIDAIPRKDHPNGRC